MKPQHSIYLGYQPFKNRKGQLCRTAPWSISYKSTFQADNKTISRTVKHLITLSSFQSHAQAHFWGVWLGLVAVTPPASRGSERKWSPWASASPTLWSQASKLKQSINIMAFNPHIPRKHLFLCPLFFLLYPLSLFTPGLHSVLQ